MFRVYYPCFRWNLSRNQECGRVLLWAALPRHHLPPASPPIAARESRFLFPLWHLNWVTCSVVNVQGFKALHVRFALVASLLASGNFYWIRGFDLLWRSGPGSGCPRGEQDPAVKSVRSQPLSRWSFILLNLLCWFNRASSFHTGKCKFLLCGR